MIDCGGLNDPVGGDVTITPAVVGSIETGLNAVAMYTCNEGYDLVGNTMRSCQESNQWDGTEPMCTCKLIMSVSSNGTYNTCM